MGDGIGLDQIAGFDYFTVSRGSDGQTDRHELDRDGGLNIDILLAGLEAGGGR